MHDRLHAAEAEGISHQTLVDTLRGVLRILRQLEERLDDRPDDPEEWQGDSRIRSCMTAASAAYAERRSQAATSPSHAQLDAYAQALSYAHVHPVMSSAQTEDQREAELSRIRSDIASLQTLPSHLGQAQRWRDEAAIALTQLHQALSRFAAYFPPGEEAWRLSPAMSAQLGSLRHDLRECRLPMAPHPFSQTGAQQAPQGAAPQGPTS